MRLARKVAIVTGAGSGIGRAIALGFVREGARVAAADRNLAAAQETSARAESDAILPVAVDVTSAEQVRAMVERVARELGQLDVLVNNAAIQLHGQDGRCHEVDEEVWGQTLAVNLTGPFLCAKYAIPALLRNGGGSIVNIASPTA